MQKPWGAISEFGLHEDHGLCLKCSFLDALREVSGHAMACHMEKVTGTKYGLLVFGQHDTDVLILRESKTGDCQQTSGKNL